MEPLQRGGGDERPMSRDFNGTTSLINCQSGGTLDDIWPGTLTGWFAPDGAGENSLGRLFGKASSQTVTRGVWHLFMTSAGRLEFEKDYTSANLRRTSEVVTLVTDGSFQHIALTWTGATDSTSVKIYKNGVEVVYGTSANATGAFISDSSHGLVIGNTEAANRTFDGRIAHVHCFRRVLSADEIKQLMFHPASHNLGIGAANSSGLIGYWSLNGLSANEPDKSGNGNVGTVTAALFDPSQPPVNEEYISGVPNGYFG